MDFRGQSNLPLGLRNNNPGDFRVGVNWIGAVGSENGFITFSDDSYGLRALAYDLSTKYNDDGLTSITDIITVYAPPSENDTAAYIAAVCQDMGGIDPNADINLDASVLASLMRAIMNHELGAQYSAMIPDADIQKGISMIPQNILDELGTLIQANPAAGYGAIGLIIALAIVTFMTWKKYGNLTFSNILNTVKNGIRSL